MFFPGPAVPRRPRKDANPDLAMGVFRAVINSDTRFILDKVISPGLIDTCWQLPAIDEIPELLHYHPPLISIAAYLGKRDILTFVQGNGASVTATDRHGRLPIHFAAAKSHDLFNLFIDWGCDIRGKDSVGRNVLHFAASCPDDSLAKRLVCDNVIPVDEADKCGMTPIMLAAAQGHATLVKLLLESGAKREGQFTLPGLPPRNLFHFACESDSPEIADLFFTPEDLERKSPDGPPLIIAAMRGRAHMIEYLLQKGAPIACFDPDMSSPLTLAARAGSFESVRLLLDAGCFIDHLNKFNESPLEAALKSGSNPCVLILLQRNASMKSLAEPPLVMAVRTGNHTLLHYLLENGISLNQVDPDGNTALHLLVEHRENEIVQSLVDVCLDELDLKNKKGNTALALATFSGQLDVMNVLLSNGADQNATNSNGYTPLAIAVRKGNFEAAKMLLEFEADPNIPDQEGRTPIFSACRENRLDLVKLLVEHNAAVEIADKYSRTPLHFSHLGKAGEISAFLRDHGATSEILQNK